MTRQTSPRHPLRTLAITTFAVLVAACGGSAGSAAAPTTTPAAPLATTTTPAPSTTVPATTTAPTTTVEPGTELLLAYGDSFARRGGWPSIYGEMAGDALGGVVEVGGISCSFGCDSILGVINGEKQRELIKQADIIVLQPYPGRVFAAAFRDFLDGACGGEDGQECLAATLADFDIYLADLLDTVTYLANPEAVIRIIPTGTWALDHFYPGVRTEDPASFEIMLTALIDFVAVIDAAAEARCIGVTNASAIFSGPDYRTPIDPLHTYDGAHPSEEGSQLIAADLHALGYAPTHASC